MRPSPAAVSPTPKTRVPPARTHSPSASFCDAVIGSPSTRGQTITSAASYSANRAGKSAGSIITGRAVADRLDAVAPKTVEPSASSFADVIEVLAASSAQAIFTDISESQAFAEQLADQVDRTVDVVPLFVGALGPEGSGAETYLGLMRWNVEAIRTVFER